MTKAMLVMLASIGCSAATSSKAAVDASVDTSDADGDAGDAAPPAPACSPTALAACGYASDLTFPVATADIDLKDPARGNFPVPVRVYYPTGTADARPIMIWSHGGNPSADGRTRSEEWGRAFAAAGYISIHPSRVPITDVTPVQSMCNAEGFPAAPDCALFVGQVVAGPIDAVFVLDSLTAIEAAVPDLAGKLDAAHVAVGGHSAGSMVPLVLAGAARQFAGPVHHDGDARPLAFLATGPQGPDYASFDAGFREDSFHDIDARPVLFISGRGDETGPVGDPAHEPAEGRTAGWLSSTRGNKLLSWDNDDTAVHETMDIHQCNAGVQATHCQAFAMLGVAFLDAFLRQRPEAVTYLASGNYETLNAGVIELHRR